MILTKGLYTSHGIVGLSWLLRFQSGDLCHDHSASVVMTCHDYCGNNHGATCPDYTVSVMTISVCHDYENDTYEGGDSHAVPSGPAVSSFSPSSTLSDGGVGDAVGGARLAAALARRRLAASWPA